MITKYHLYDKTVQLVFNEFKHQYSVQGKTVPSATQILQVIAKPALINWAANMAVETIEDQIEPGVSYDEMQLRNIFDAGKKAHWTKKKEAGDVGSFLHNWVEKYIKGLNPPMPVNTDLKEAVLKFLNWVEEHNVKFLLSEQLVFSKKYFYSGTLDFICKMDGNLYIGDMKTSKAIYSEMWMQTAAYRQARSEEYPKEDYKGQLIIRIGKDGSFEYEKHEEDEFYKLTLKAFLAALILRNSLEELKSG